MNGITLKHRENQNTTATIRGVLTDIRSIPTNKGTAFVVCKVGGQRCKMFYETAQMVLNHHEYEDTEQEVYGYLDTKRNRDKFAPEFVIQGFGSEPASNGFAPVQQTIGQYMTISIPAQISTWEQYHEAKQKAEKAINEVYAKLSLLAKAIPPDQTLLDVPF
jgi:hypothetical protein